MKFCTRVSIHPLNDRGKFELDRARRKINIAENSFALGHETHNSNIFTTLGYLPYEYVPSIRFDMIKVYVYPIYR